MGFVSSKNQFNFGWTLGAAFALSFFLDVSSAHAIVCEFPAGSGNMYNYNFPAEPAPTGPLMPEQNANGGMLGESVVFPPGAALQDFGQNNNIGGFGIRNGQNGWDQQILSTLPPGVTPISPAPPTGPIATALQNKCKFPIWVQAFEGYPVTGNDEYAMVMLYGTPQAMNNAVFRFVSGDGNVPGAAIPVFSSRTDPGLPQRLRDDVLSSMPAETPAWGYVYRYAAIHIPAGTSDSLRMMAASSRQGVIYYRAFRKITWQLGSQNMQTAERKTRYRPRLAFLAPDPGTVIVNTCSPMRRAIPIDGAGNQVTVLVPDARGNTFNVELSLAGDPADLFRDANCIYPVVDPGIHNPPRPAPTPANGQAQQPSHAPHSNRLEFWLKSDVAQQFSVTVNHEGNPKFPAYQEQVVLPEPPTHMKLSGPGSVNQSECSAMMRVKFYDRLGNHTALQSPATIQVTPGGYASLYSNATCTNSISNSMNVSTGVSTVEFYLKDPNAETLEISAVGGGLNGDSMTFRVLSLGLIGVPASPAAAKRIAERMWNRIVGTPVDLGSPTQVAAADNMTNMLMQGRALEAANIATQQKNFLDITVRGLATTLSNRIKDPAFGLTDFVTTWIGIIRDNESAQQLLLSDYVYVPESVKINNNQEQCAQSAAYTNNAAFNAIVDQGLSISDNIRKKRQCIFNSPRNFGSTPQPLNDAAGLLTTRGWAAAHFYMGTNRRALEFTFDVFMCKSLDDIRDTYAPDYRVRRDVSRAPGGDPKVYNTDCMSCHGTMDAASGAFAFFDYYPNPSNDDPNPVTSADARLFYARTGYADGDWKYNINPNTFPAGWITGDDSWLNFYTNERNADQLGWSENVPSSGFGAKSLATMFANSRAFAECMSKRVFAQLCKRPADGGDTGILTAIVDDFIGSNYNMKRLYARVAALQTCSGSGE